VPDYGSDKPKHKCIIWIFIDFSYYFCTK